MNGLTIIETAQFEQIKQDISDLKEMILQLADKSNKPTKPLNLYEAAKYLGRSYDWTFKHKHDIGCSRAGSRWVMTTEKLDQYIQSTYHKNY